MIGALYERALAGERCWLRRADGHIEELPVERWRGDSAEDDQSDTALAAMCEGPTIDLACGPGRLVARLMRSGLPALGVDESPYAVRLAVQPGALALRGDVFGPLPGVGWWQTVLLADGNVGIGGDPSRVLDRARALLRLGGHCVVEFDATATGVSASMVRLEAADTVGPWFCWAAVGLDGVEELGDRAGLRLKDVAVMGDRAACSLAAI